MSSGMGRGRGLGSVRANSWGSVVLVAAFLSRFPWEILTASWSMRISISGRHLKDTQHLGCLNLKCSAHKTTSTGILVHISDQTVRKQTQWSMAWTPLSSLFSCMFTLSLCDRNERVYRRCAELHVTSASNQSLNTALKGLKILFATDCCHVFLLSVNYTMCRFKFSIHFLSYYSVIT